MKKNLKGSLLFVLMLAIATPVMAQQDRGKPCREGGRAKEAAVDGFGGAVFGALIGVVANPKDRGQGALRGAMVGGGVGAAVGATTASCDEVYGPRETAAQVMQDAPRIGRTSAQSAPYEPASANSGSRQRVYIRDIGGANTQRVRQHATSLLAKHGLYSINPKRYRGNEQSVDYTIDITITSVGRDNSGRGDGGNGRVDSVSIGLDQARRTGQWFYDVSIETYDRDGYFVPEMSGLLEQIQITAYEGTRTGVRVRVLQASYQGWRDNNSNTTDPAASAAVAALKVFFR
ncbi:MAG: hypothetical protein Q8Q39_00870 [bacterium]|nr:hypothetical protein [bacterium]